MSGNRSESHNPQKQDSNENNSNIGFSRILKSHSEQSFFCKKKLLILTSYEIVKKNYHHFSQNQPNKNVDSKSKF